MRPFFVLLLACVCGVPLLAADAPDAGKSKPTLNNEALEKLGWTLGCQAWTFRDRTLFETLDTLNGLGLRYIEIYPGQMFSPEKKVKFDHNAPPELVDEFLAKCKATGVTPVNYGVVGLSGKEDQDRKVFDFAKKLGLQTIVSEPPEDAFEALDKLCGEYQINVAIHDHPKPSHYWNPDAVLKVTQDRSKRIGACADVGHWYRSGLTPVECLKKLQGRIISLHFKDIDKPERKGEDVPWGTGGCDVPAMLAEIKRQNIHPVFSIEYETGKGKELEANVRKCIEFFSEQATKLANEK
jgi:sugar phosphate isomerase/epimerase